MKKIPIIGGLPRLLRLFAALAVAVCAIALCAAQGLPPSTELLAASGILLFLSVAGAAARQPSELAWQVREMPKPPAHHAAPKAEPYSLSNAKIDSHDYHDLLV